MSDQDNGGIARIVEPREADIGGMIVRRSLPVIGTRSIGPWVFFDHFGPVTMSAGNGLDVIPHPHINLATVTYLFDGEIEHRDTIGNIQRIRPGAINLMVAGSGIAHSERTPSENRTATHSAHGMQFWFGLPEDAEEVEPSFHHVPADTFPVLDVDHARVRVLIGDAFGFSSPVPTFSPTLLAELRMPVGSRIELPETYSELAIYVIDGSVRVGESLLPKRNLVLLSQATRLECDVEAHVAVIGGETLGTRHMWWNFVSSRKERIEQAKADWKADRFGTIPGEIERHPLPEHDD